MALVRSAVFMLSFWLNTALQMIIFTPVYFIVPRHMSWKFVHFWSRTNCWLMRVIIGTRFEVHGAHNLPEGGYILAPKHQSAWDTFGLLPWLDDPVYILKRELMWIPLFGWYVARMGMIAINRGDRETSVAKVNAGLRAAMDAGRQLLIYPEGTRVKPGQEPRYKSGISHLYVAAGVPVVPVAHNAGLFWPKRGVMKYPGVIKVEILEPIPAGLPRKEFMATLIDRIETACNRQLEEYARDPDAPPLPQQYEVRSAR